MFDFQCNEKVIEIYLQPQEIQLKYKNVPPDFTHRQMCHKTDSIVSY